MLAVVAAVIGVLVVALGVGVLANLDLVRLQPLPGAGVTPLPLSIAASQPPDAVRVLAAGDVAECDSPGAAATAALLAAAPDAIVLPVGDLAYPHGTPEDFANCYDPTWGVARDRSHPVLGNHDFETSEAAGYFGYWGDSVGSVQIQHRVMELGAWRVYLLSSECGQNGDDCSFDDQVAWLQEDLAAHPTACILAAYHKPRFSSGPHGSNAAVDDLWRALADAGADIVLNGHDHLYERFTPLDADGDPADGGTREFVVGTGGAQLYAFEEPLPGSEARTDTTFGVLELVLRPDSYDWSFLAALGEPFEDAGSSTC